MSGETQPYLIPVTVEWALWGKERSDLEYRLLRCSDGTLSEANFDELLTRYSTGTLEALPQVTIGWLEDRAHGHQIALAIHEEPADRRVDATGRPVVLTRCFCVPYAVLAEGRVSYQAMYEQFRKIPLDEQVGTFEATLPAMSAVSYVDWSALRAAALLVTCRPVCILDADRVSLTERLVFIDSVMSLLPFGLRCQLSASTWASSQFWEHKFRLFFAGALRPDDDCDVNWGADRRPLTQPEAAEYLDWLQNDASDLASQLAGRVAQLGRRTDPVRFRSAEVEQSLGELYAIPDGSRRRRRPPASAPRALPPGGRAERTTEDLLIECANRIRGQDQVLIIAAAIRQVAERSGDKTTVEERDRYRQIIKEYRLLREDGPLEGHLRDHLYPALLGIAFETPLDYEGYCQLEDCAGLAPGQLMHPSLLKAVGRARIDDLCVELILAGADDDEFRTLSKAQVPLAGLVEAAADLRLDVTHRRAVFETALNEFLVRERDRRLDTQRLRSALAEHVCLGSAVQQIYQNSQYRLNALCTLLKLAYGQTLSRANIRTILSAVDGEPTSDLFFAVVDMSDPRDADFAERTFTRSLARRYDADTESEFLRRFPDRGQRDAANESPRLAPDGNNGSRGARQPPSSGGQPRKTASHALQRFPRIQIPSHRKEPDGAVVSPAVGQGDNWVKVTLVVVVVVVCFLVGAFVLARIL